MRSYPRVYGLGHEAVKDLLLDPVLVEEKLDGSQFNFGLLDGRLTFRSKAAGIYPEQANVPKLFAAATSAVEAVADRLTPGWTYRGEALHRPKHNILPYGRVPLGNVAVFDVSTGEESYLSYNDKVTEALRLGLEVVPILYQGRLERSEELVSLLDRESFLGGTKIEGVVIKNYARFGVDGKALMGKYVSEAFKESHKQEWKAGPDIITLLAQDLRTEARWLKAIQHRAERGELLNAPQDIGPLLKEINEDVLAEECEWIKERLLKHFWKDISRRLTHGFPQWYKDRLMEAQFVQS